MQHSTPDFLKPHRRQFVIGPTALRADEDWHCIPLGDSVWLSHCPDLPVDWRTDLKGNRWYLLGRAIETLASKPNPLAQIAQFQDEDIQQLYTTWTNRWVLIGCGQVHLDASALLGCFYGTTKQEKVWISSSPALAAQVFAVEESLTVDPRLLRYRAGVAWFTPPQSRFAEIRRLLPSQILNFSSGIVQPRPLIPAIKPELSYEQTLEALQANLATALKRLTEQAGCPWLGLSAGYDSRLVLAIARYANVQLKTFTRVAVRVPVGDRTIPPRLAEICGYPHTFLRPSYAVSDRLKIALDHTAHHVSEGDVEPFVQGVRDSLDGVSIGGQCFGVGKALFRGKLPDQIEDPEIGSRQILQARKESSSPTAIAGLRDWLEWTLKTPHPHLDWRDRFYIEQRLAGWQSSKEQLYDLLPPERVFIVNSAQNYALLLGLPEEQRQNCQHQVEMIRQTVPDSLSYPFNPDDQSLNLFQQTLAKVRYPRTLIAKWIQQLQLGA